MYLTAIRRTLCLLFVLGNFAIGPSKVATGESPNSDAPDSKGTTPRTPTAAELRERALKRREWLNKLLTDYYKQYPEADLNGDGQLTSPERSYHVAKLYREKTLKEFGDKIRFQGDVEYAKAGSISLKLDLYLPARIDPANKPPLVTWFHGGGWRGGSKERCIVAWLATKEFAVASVEYRSTLQVPFPANIHDCKAAIRWLRANAGIYGYDARRIGTSGASAGGHLATILGTSADVEALEGTVGDNLDQSSRVQAIVDMAGVMSIPDWANTPRGLSTILGIVFSENNGVAELGALCSPDRHLTPDDPPILIMHGDNDKVVPVKQSQDFHVKYRQAGLESTLEVIPRGGHAGGPFTDAKRKSMLEAFFARHLRQQQQ